MEDDLRQRLQRLEKRVTRIAVTFSLIVGLAIFVALDLSFGEYGLAVATVGTMLFAALAVRYLVDK